MTMTTTPIRTDVALTIAVPADTHPAPTLQASGTRDLISGAKFLATLMNVTNHNQSSQTIVENPYRTTNWEAHFHMMQLQVGHYYFLVVTIVPANGEAPISASKIFKAV
jgi:hypothetical protein